MATFDFNQVAMMTGIYNAPRDIKTLIDPYQSLFVFLASRLDVHS
jgi:hypothetical protein